MRIIITRDWEGTAIPLKDGGKILKFDTYSEAVEYAKSSEICDEYGYVVGNEPSSLYKDNHRSIKSRAEFLPNPWDAEISEKPTRLEIFIHNYQPERYNKAVEFREALIKTLDEYNV